MNTHEAAGGREADSQPGGEPVDAGAPDRDDAGDSARRAEWLVALRERFTSIARRRVAVDAVEDIVQDSLRVIWERGVRGPGSLGPEAQPALAFCMQVLRNVIGNYYQKEAVQRRRRAPSGPQDATPDPAPLPIESLESNQAVRIVGECIASMQASDPDCSRYLSRLSEGLSAGEVAREERLDEAALYRRVYRCRIKLRALLAKHGVEA